jgi:hypothetical protein
VHAGNAAPEEAHTSYLSVYFALLSAQLCLPLAHQLLWVWLLKVLDGLLKHD